MICRSNLQDYILRALSDCPETRDSDRLLFITVLDEWGRDHDMNVLGLTVREYYTKVGFPDYQSVVRIRRKMQMLHPEYQSTKQMAKYREEQEELWRAWSHE